MGRNGRRNLGVVGRHEQAWQVVERTTSAGDIEHCPDEKTDHMVKKAVGFDLEHQAARSIAPARLVDATVVIIVGRRRSQHCEAPKAVVTREVGGRRIQSAPIQGLPECELVPTTKRRLRCVIRADVVTVASTHCTVPRVELVAHLRRAGDPHVLWQNRVQSPPQLADVPAIRHPHTDGLPSGVYARVGTTRAQRGNRGAAQSLERCLEHALYGALFRLPLPPAELCPVIVQHELHGPLGHR